MATDWEKFAEEIRKDVLDELGNREIFVEVPQGTKGRSSTGKKTEVSVKRYRGAGVLGKYDSEFPSSTETVIKAGDMKAVVSFDDPDFVPSEKLNEVLTAGGVRYSVISVGQVAPNAETNVVFVIQVRRVN